MSTALLPILKYTWNELGLTSKIFGEAARNRVQEVLNSTLKSQVKLVAVGCNYYETQRIQSTAERIVSADGSRPYIIDCLTTNTPVDYFGLNKPIVSNDSSSTTDADQRIYGKALEAINATFAQLPIELENEARKDKSPISNLMQQNYLELIIELVKSPTVSEARAKARPSIEATLRTMISQDQPRRDFREYAQYANFSSQLNDMVTYNWRETVILKSEDVVSSLIHFYPLEHALRDLESAINDLKETVAWDQFYYKLESFPNREINRWIRRIRASPELTISQPQKEILENLIRKANWITSQLKDPTFNRCILLNGSWGSGKTRHIRETINWCLEHDHAVIYLDTRILKQLEKGILKKSFELYGIKFRTINELAGYLNSGSVKLFILIDDLHVLIHRRPKSLGLLADLIRSTVDTGNIYWLITADETYFDRLNVDQMDRLWGTYGAKELQDSNTTWPKVQGWTNLDEMNYESQFGFNLIAEHGNSSNRSETDAIQHTEEYSSIEQLRHGSLSNPLPAWIYIETSNDRGENGVLNWNGIEFVRRYWGSRTREFPALGIDREVLDSLMMNIAIAYSEEAISDLDEKQLLTKLKILTKSDITAKFKKYPGGINTLNNIGLIHRTLTGDPETTSHPNDIILIPEFFWGYRIAKAILKESENYQVPAEYLEIALGIWDDAAKDGDWLAENICMFGLVMAAENGQVRRNWNGQTAEDLWNLWSWNSELSLAPMLLAGIWASDNFMRIIGVKIAGAHGPDINDRDLFVLLRLALWSDYTGWDAQQRFRSFRSEHGRISSLGLGAYFVHTVDVVIRKRNLASTESYLSLLNYFAGILDPHNSANVARIVIDKGWKNSQKSLASWSSTIISFLRSTELLVDIPEDSHFQPLDLSDDNGRIPLYHFWQFAIERSIYRIIREYGIESFRLLADAGWFKAMSKHGKDKIRVEIVSDMMSQLNTGITTHYRAFDHSTEVSQQFFGLLDDLAKGAVPEMTKWQQHQSLFYLVKHTSITRYKKLVIIEPAFHHYLVDLWNDRETRIHLDRKLSDLLDANNIDAKNFRSL